MLALAAASSCLRLFAASDKPPDTTVRSGDVTITLPADAPRDVSFAFGDGKLSLKLPKGAGFPLDFEHESNGLLRAGEVVPVDDSHVRCDLKLGSGVVDAIDVSATSVVVKVRRRFAETKDAGESHDDEYRLGAEDKIQVAVNGDSKLTQQVVIGRDDRASLPLVGDVTLGGLTLREATETVTELLARDYLVDPKVDIQVTEYKSQWVMVTGEVVKPGRVALRGAPTLKDALADADGLAVGAGEDITISRDAPDGSGKTMISVDRLAFEQAAINPPLRTGDIISVPARLFVYVQGEVRQPGKIPLERGMTLMKAISSAGSLTEWASEKSVQIISEGAVGDKRVFNLKDIRSMRIPDPSLRGGDVIYVRRRFL